MFPIILANSFLYHPNKPVIFCMCVYMFMHFCLCICVGVYIYVSASVCVYLLYVCFHLQVSICMCLHMRFCLCMCPSVVYLCICVCMCVCVCVHMCDRWYIKAMKRGVYLEEQPLLRKRKTQQSSWFWLGDDCCWTQRGMPKKLHLAHIPCKFILSYQASNTLIPSWI
jgi:hypothetical protein